MRLRACALFLSFLTLAAGPAGRQRPDFSGTWRASTQPPPGLEAAPSAVFGPTFALAQEGGTLTLTRPFRDDVVVIPYRLDGSRTHFKVPGRMCEGDAEYIETAAWEGDGVAITLVGTIAAGASQEREQKIRRVLRRGEADTVVVETAISRAGKPVPVATVYARTTETLPAPARPAATGPPARIAQMDWLPGFWTGKTQTLSLEERWTPLASGSTLGLARSLRGSSLASFEFLCIAEKNGTLVYTAMPDGRTTPTHFTLTRLTDDSATFENPAHDFPQMIRYTRRPDGSLETTISGANNARAQSFILQKEK
jgi:hypothetical protein